MGIDQVISSKMISETILAEVTEGDNN